MIRAWRGLSRGWRIALGLIGAVVVVNLAINAAGNILGHDPSGPSSSSYATNGDGLAGLARLYAANGLQIGQGYELDAIAAVILGGTSFVGGIGSIWGTLIGALIIAMLTNGLILLGISDIWQYIIKGLVIIGAVALDRYRLREGGRT